MMRHRGVCGPRGSAVHLLGRGLYETMLYWETADQDPSLDDSMLEWAALWKPLPKVVFSTTLRAVQGHARLASSGVAEERRVDLELVQTRTFSSRVVYLRYRVARLAGSSAEPREERASQ